MTSWKITRWTLKVKMKQKEKVKKYKERYVKMKVVKFESMLQREVKDSNGMFMLKKLYKIRSLMDC